MTRNVKRLWFMAAVVLVAILVLVLERMPTWIAPWGNNTVVKVAECALLAIIVVACGLEHIAQFVLLILDGPSKRVPRRNEGESSIKTVARLAVWVCIGSMLVYTVCVCALRQWG